MSPVNKRVILVVEDSPTDEALLWRALNTEVLPKFGQGPKVDFRCFMRQTWESTEGSSAQT